MAPPATTGGTANAIPDVSMSSESLHEPIELLATKTRDLHRALVSLMEELEAVDWYTQRAEACSDPALAAVLRHHRDEEIEHAMMNLEWILRNEPVFADHAKRYLFTDEPIVEIEAAAEKRAAGRRAYSLEIGSLRRGSEEG